MAVQSGLRSRSGWVFWILWLLATTAAVVLFMIVSPLIFSGMSILFGGVENTTSGMLTSMTGTVAMGALIGLGQWLVLRMYLKRSGWWVLATLIGYSLPFSIGYLIPPSFYWLGRLNPGWLTGAVLFLTFGLTLGVLQWLVLRGRVNQAGWWIVISLASWAIVTALIDLVYLSGLYVEPFDMYTAFFVPLILGGAGMVLLLRRTPAPTA